MLLLLLTLFLHYDLFSCVIEEKANFNETALMKQHHENYIQVKTFIKDAQKKFKDNTATRVDYQPETTRDMQTTDVRNNWLFGNSSLVDSGNDHLPYLPFGRSRPTFPEEITPYTTERKDHHLKWDEIIPNQKSKTNESTFGIDFELTTTNSTNHQLSSVSLINSKDRKGFKPGVFEIRLNPEVSKSSKKEHFILKLSDPIESSLHIDNADPSTVKPSSNLHPSSKVPIVDPEYQKRFHPNESRSRFVHSEFSLHRPMSDFKSPSKKYTVDPYNQTHVEGKSETGDYRNRSTTEETRTRNPSIPPLKTSTSSVKYQYRFDPSLQTKEFILRVKPVLITEKSSSPSPKILKLYPKKKHSFNPTSKAKIIILLHSSKTTTKPKVSSKTFNPSSNALKSSSFKSLKSSSNKGLKSSSTKGLKSSSIKTFKSFRPKTLKTSTKVLKSFSAKNLKFGDLRLDNKPKILKPPLPKKSQSMKPPHAKPTFLPKTSLRGHSGEGFKFNTSLRRPNEVYKKKWFREVTTYMPVESWVLTLVAKIGLTTRHDFAANPTSNLGRVSARPHALVSNKQLKKTSQNQAINFFRQGPPRTRTMIEDHILSTKTAEYEDYSLPTTPTKFEDYRLSTTTIENEDYRPPTTTKEVGDYKLPTTSTNVKHHRLLTTSTENEDYSLPTTPTNVRDYRLSTTTTKYEDYDLSTKPINIEDYGLSTTTKEVEDYSLPTTSTQLENHTLSTTVTKKPKFTIENQGGILHLVTIPEDYEETARVGRPGFIVEDEEILEPLTTVDVRYRGPVMISSRDGMYGAQNLAAQKILDKTRRNLLKEKKKKRHPYHRHSTRQKNDKHKHRHRKNRKKNKKQKKQEMEYPLLFTDLRKRLSIGTAIELSKENRSSEKQKNGETYPLKAIPELSHNDTVIKKVFRLMETQDRTPELDNKNLYNKVKETLKQAQIRKEVERQKKKAELIRRIAEGSSYSDEEESLKRNLVQALQYGNRTLEYEMPFI